MITKFYAGGAALVFGPYKSRNDAIADMTDYDRDDYYVVEAQGKADAGEKLVAIQDDDEWDKHKY